MNQLLFSTKIAEQGKRGKAAAWLVIKAVIYLALTFILCFLLEESYVQQIKDLNLDYFSEYDRIQEVSSTISSIFTILLLIDAAYIGIDAIITIQRLSMFLEIYSDKVIGAGYQGLTVKEFCLLHNQINHIELKAKTIKIYSGTNVYSIITTKTLANQALGVYNDYMNQLYNSGHHFNMG